MHVTSGPTHVVRWLKLHVYDPVVRTFTAFGQDDGYLLAAGVAYYVGLSLFPVLLVLISALGLFLEFTHLGQDAKQEVLDAIAVNASHETAQQVGTVLEQLGANANVSTPVSVAILLFTAGTVFAQFERAFDRIWRYTAPEDLGWIATIKSVLIDRLTAFVLLLGVAALVLLTFISATVLESIQQFADHYLPLPPASWATLQAVVAITVNTAAFGMLYHTLPRARVRWKEAFRGGLIVAIVWEVGRRVLTAYLIGGRYTAYGVVGALIAVQLWAYYAVTVILLGAEYVRVTCKYCTGEAAAEATRRRFWQLMTKMYARKPGAPVSPPVTPPGEPAHSPVKQP